MNMQDNIVYKKSTKFTYIKKLIIILFEVSLDYILRRFPFISTFLICSCHFFTHYFLNLSFSSHSLYFSLAISTLHFFTNNFLFFIFSSFLIFFTYTLPLFPALKVPTLFFPLYFFLRLCQTCNLFFFYTHFFLKPFM